MTLHHAAAATIGMGIVLMLLAAMFSIAASLTAWRPDEALYIRCAVALVGAGAIICIISFWMFAA